MCANILLLYSAVDSKVTSRRRNRRTDALTDRRTYERTDGRAASWQTTFPKNSAIKLHPVNAFENASVCSCFDGFNAKTNRQTGNQLQMTMGYLKHNADMTITTSHKVTFASDNLSRLHASLMVKAGWHLQLVRLECFGFQM